MNSIPRHIYITSNEALAEHCAAIKAGSDWIGFDTEFIGERRYVPLLCLIQISSEIGNFLIDTLEVDGLAPFCSLLEDADLLKITHAGENDYQLMRRLFGTLPKNVVDVQVAAGFLGDGYPCSFQKIASKYAKAKISKSQTVTDWQARPFRDKQLRYALNDVIYLQQIWNRTKGKLERRNRLEWVREECSKFCTEEYYAQDLLSSILSSKLMYNLSPKEQVFAIRLSLWREAEAESKNLSREKVLSSKAIPIIVRMMKSGKQSLMSDRRIQDHVIRKLWDQLNELYQKTITEEEEGILARIPSPPVISDEQNILMDLLNQIFKFICIKQKVAGMLLMPRADFNKMKHVPDYVPEYLKAGWRLEVLGEDVISWLENRDKINIRFEEGEFRIGVED